MFKCVDDMILKICQKDFNYFLSKSNVVGIGLGYQMKRGKYTCQKSIQVFVKQKIPAYCLTTNDLIPSFYKGIKTDVIETGTFKACSLNQRIRPVTGGYSISPSGIFTSGTYGALVTDEANFYMLSNNHVLALENLLPLGNPILQPSTEDNGSSPNDIVATLSKFVPIQFIDELHRPPNEVDAAIAKIIKPDIASSMITFFGTPKTIGIPLLNLQIQAACRTSERIQGTITTLGASIIVEYPIEGAALFTNQILFNTPTFNGDSGALILDLNNYALGLLFTSSENYSAFNPITTVLSELEVFLVTE